MTITRPVAGLTVQRQASLTLSDAARRAHRDDEAARRELLQFLDMLGLPPCQRPLRTSDKGRYRFGGAS
ncbi:MAG: hypothetical protein ACRD0W_00625 [Acidimicrobiales bacterium]